MHTPCSILKPEGGSHYSTNFSAVWLCAVNLRKSHNFFTFAVIQTYRSCLFEIGGPLWNSWGKSWSSVLDSNWCFKLQVCIPPRSLWSADQGIHFGVSQKMALPPLPHYTDFAKGTINCRHEQTWRTPAFSWDKGFQLSAKSHGTIPRFMGVRAFMVSQRWRKGILRTFA